jgi:hypothetical protein
MRRRLAALAAIPVLAIAVSASPALAAGSPLAHDVIPAEALGSLCGYTFLPGGYITDVYRPGDIGPDGIIHSAHLTLHNVWAVRDGLSYRVFGMEAYTDLWGATAKLMFVGQDGGLAAMVNIVTRDAPNGGFLRDLGTCSWF